jgi:hypothetical protein
MVGSLTGIEDDLVIGGKFASDGLPECLEVRSRGNDTSRAVRWNLVSYNTAGKDQP